MLQKIYHLNRLYVGAAPEGSHALERDGHYLLRAELSRSEVLALQAEILAVYERVPPDARAGRTSPENAAMFRYEMFNRGAACHAAIGHPAILAAIEPALELVELRSADFGVPSDEAKAWICLSRRRTVPAQPSTRR